MKGIELKNSVLKEVKSIYGDTFCYLKKAFENFEKLLNIEISDNEIGFLVPIFEVALKNKIEKSKRVIIISSYKKNVINFLISRLKEEFLIDIVEIVSMKHLDKINYENIDLVITTSDSNIEIENDIPICKVSPILTENDIRELNKMKIPYQDKKISLEKLMNVIKKNITGVEINETKLKEELLYNFSSNIATEKNEKLTEEFIIPQGLLAEVTNCTLQEGIKIGAELLLKEKCISKIYLEELVTKVNEELLYLFLNENTILVYADPKDNVLKTAFSLVKMKKSLIFKDKKVKNLVCFAPKGDTQDQKILFELNDYFEKSRV